MSNGKSKLKKGLRKLPPKDQKPDAQNGGNWFLWLVLIFASFMLFGQFDAMNKGKTVKEITYSEFYSIVQDNSQTGEIKKLVLVEEGLETELKGTFKDGTEFSLNIPKNDEGIIDLIRTNVDDFAVIPPETFWSQLFFSFMPILLFIGFLWFVSYRGSQVGNRLWAFGKSRARSNNKGEHRITFSDVAGVDEAKEELQEVIEFLKDPKRFQRLGGRIPKGFLLVGAPGTGKTLLAKAVAGEADVPFFSLSGSDFVEMFVGVGASRVRDLYEQARKASKASGKGCIIFIDEIDAVGRQRFAGIGGGNDEREQTLNALLVEMDGFNTQSGLIVIAATNRPDTLDPALLRPGRFDRQIVVDLPDIKGREGILAVHSKNIKTDASVDLKAVARQTVYFSGADLANVCNEAALLAARKGKDFVTQSEMLAAVERVTMGPEKKSRVISRKEKINTAYHEAGHALLSLLVEGVDRFTKISIIPRGMAGGYTLTPPKEDKHYLNKKELIGRMIVLLGGYVAEEICLGVTTTGVQNDLERVSKIARQMICEFGMNETLAPMAFGEKDRQRFLGRDLFEGKDYSEETARNIDKEIQQVVKAAHDDARKLLLAHRDKLELIKNKLIEKEVIDIEETKLLLGLELNDETEEEALPSSQSESKTSDNK